MTTSGYCPVLLSGKDILASMAQDLLTQKISPSDMLTLVGTIVVSGGVGANEGPIDGLTTGD
jgi:hypothetical protein